MWQTEWADPGKSTTSEPRERSLLALDGVESVYLLHWGEHCLECATPDCYTQCSVYVRRRDGKCARFQNGIQPNPRYSGLYPYGAEIHFRRWGQLHSTLDYGAVSPAEARRFDQVDRTLVKAI